MRGDFLGRGAQDHVDGRVHVLVIGRASNLDFDVCGHYSRPEVFQLEVNTAPMQAVVSGEGGFARRGVQRALKSRLVVSF